MAKWRIWNKHSLGFTHREKFKDDLIEIKAGAYITMDYEEAVQFKSQYFPMKKKPTGEDDPAGWKMLFLEPDGATQSAQQASGDFICQMDGLKFPTQRSLDLHIEENYADRVFKDDVLEAQIKDEAAKKKTKATQGKEKSA